MSFGFAIPISHFFVWNVPCHHQALCVMKCSLNSSLLTPTQELLPSPILAIILSFDMVSHIQDVCGPYSELGPESQGKPREHLETMHTALSISKVLATCIE